MCFEIVRILSDQMLFFVRFLSLTLDVGVMRFRQLHQKFDPPPDILKKCFLFLFDLNFSHTPSYKTNIFYTGLLRTVIFESSC